MPEGTGRRGFAHRLPRQKTACSQRKPTDQQHDRQLLEVLLHVGTVERAGLLRQTDQQRSRPAMGQVHPGRRRPVAGPLGGDCPAGRLESCCEGRQILRPAARLDRETLPHTLDLVKAVVAEDRLSASCAGSSGRSRRSDLRMGFAASPDAFRWDSCPTHSSHRLAVGRTAGRTGESSAGAWVGDVFGSACVSRRIVTAGECSLVPVGRSGCRGLGP